MFNNNGFLNEKEIYEAIDGNMYCELSPFLQEVVKTCFPEIREDGRLRAGKCYVNAKPDIFIEYHTKMKYISIKSGASESVHQEPLESFIAFLKDNNVSSSTLETILLFHFGDGTINGTGNERKDYNSIMVDLKDRIHIANTELRDRKLVGKMVNRALFNGTDKTAARVDFFVHGNKNYGIIISREQVFTYIIRRSYKYIQSPHIGPFVLQPYLRDIERTSKHSEKRFAVTFKWYRLLADFQKIQEEAGS